MAGALALSAVAYAVNFLRASGTWPDGILYKYKDITSQPSYSQIVDDSYASQALAKLGS